VTILRLITFFNNFDYFWTQIKKIAYTRNGKDTLNI